MKKNNKKGFTIVELVIVIAVIAILSAVLIPTFGGIIEDANNTARDQEAKNLFTEYLIDHQATAPDGTTYVLVDSYYYAVSNNQIDLDSEKTSVENPTIIAHDTDCEANTGSHNCKVCNSAVSECDTKGTDGKCSVCGK